MEGLRLFTSDGERSIDWQAIAQDGRLHRGWLFRRLSLPQHAAVLGWLPGWKRGFWRAFEARLQAHRQPLVESTLREIEAQLKSRYPRQSLWLGLSRQADEVLAPFEGSSPSAGEDPLVRRLRQIATADNSLLERYREHYIAQQQRAFGSLFARVERQPLTVAQQRACIIDDDRNLVLAGAGTGKTSTLIARVAYLVASRQAQPHEILLLAYGREAATEMQQRLQQRLGIPVTATTFHALGQRIIAAVEGLAPRSVHWHPRIARSSAGWKGTSR
ncbi:UvrD-helicase domain-containing protein [Marinobacterium aestuariivivens]|uniref:UvrD-helicase domain-containing protein n=1 Tax=Marinobacterium aestuariivivens TaxID=1698799 RepID=A0ABW2A7M0_9GAMM